MRPRKMQIIFVFLARKHDAAERCEKMPMQRTDEARHGHGAERKLQGFFGLFFVPRFAIRLFAWYIVSGNSIYLFSAAFRI
jgi:hypothetical protein